MGNFHGKVPASYLYSRVITSKSMQYVCHKIFPPVRLFQTVRLLFYTNSPSSTFIPDRTFISVLRVYYHSIIGKISFLMSTICVCPQYSTVVLASMQIISTQFVCNHLSLNIYFTQKKAQKSIDSLKRVWLQIPLGICTLVSYDSIPVWTHP